MQSFVSDPSDIYMIHYRESKLSTVEDRIIGWVICTHEDSAEIHPVVICEGRALCAETAAQQFGWLSWEIQRNQYK